MHRLTDDPLGGVPGYCRVTGGEESKGCSPRTRNGFVGGWYDGPAMVRVAQCLELCAKCEPCRFISYSKHMNDCSWFQQCDISNLNTKSSQLHKSYGVRHENGTILPAVAARLAAHERRRAAALSGGSAWVNEPARRLFFHEDDPVRVFLKSVRPDFKGDVAFASGQSESAKLDILREWSDSIRTSPLSAGVSSGRQHGRCAVVGSSAALLHRKHGPRIDSHDAVYRVNEAPVEEFGKHVGRRTTVRMWGFQKMPDINSKWALANHTIVIYCGPTPWVGNCWQHIPTTGRPRLSPFAWEEANLAVHGAAAASAKTYPSSGLMAVWVALAQCATVTLFGFGWCSPSDAKANGLAHNAVYYDPHDKRGKSGFQIYHNMEKEWAWLRSLQAQGLLKRAC